MIKKTISNSAVFLPKLLRLLPINDVQEELHITEQRMLLDEFSDLKSYGFLGPMEGNRIKQSHDDEGNRLGGKRASIKFAHDRIRATDSGANDVDDSLSGVYTIRKQVNRPAAR